MCVGEPPLNDTSGITVGFSITADMLEGRFGGSIELLRITLRVFVELCIEAARTNWLTSYDCINSKSLDSAIGQRWFPPQPYWV